MSTAASSKTTSRCAAGRAEVKRHEVDARTPHKRVDRAQVGHIGHLLALALLILLLRARRRHRTSPVLAAAR